MVELRSQITESAKILYVITGSVSGILGLLFIMVLPVISVTAEIDYVITISSTKELTLLDARDQISGMGDTTLYFNLGLILLIVGSIASSIGGLIKRNMIPVGSSLQLVSFIVFYYSFASKNSNSNSSLDILTVEPTLWMYLFLLAVTLGIATAPVSWIYSRLNESISVYH